MESKYLKYKQKYQNLKKAQTGGEIELDSKVAVILNNDSAIFGIVKFIYKENHVIELDNGSSKILRIVKKDRIREDTENYKNVINMDIKELDNQLTDTF